MMSNTIDTLNNVTVLLSSKSKSFCYYEIEDTGTNKEEFISTDRLKDIIRFSNNNKIHLNFSYGNSLPPRELSELMSKVEHSKILPVSLLSEYRKDDIVIVDEQSDSISHTVSDLNMILRFTKKDISSYAGRIKDLIGTFKRLTIILVGIDGFSEEELEQYKIELVKIKKLFLKEVVKNNFEVNVITDRLVLNQMNNCDAGIKHITYALDGNFYLCPGFYFSGSESIGSINEGIQIRFKRLLEIDNSPVCKLCDAFHCKRCFYLNKKATLEYNIPSEQQCKASHYEREISRNVLRSLKHMKMHNKSFSEIPVVDYSDPMELIEEGRIIDNTSQKQHSQKQDDSRVLQEILETQKEILAILKNK